jgi:beta-lactamase class A
MEGGVYLRELTGRRLAAEKNAGNSIFAASIYKLWVAQFVLEKTDLNQEAFSGKTYGQCLDLMIRVSDNDCPHKIIDKHGGSVMNAYVAGNGFGSTSLTNNSTSPRDAGRFLERLYSGSLLDGDKTGQLLGLLRSQVYRAGIPAGSPGASVADKPGFYGDSWHDAAIVEGPKSTYVLVIMTKGAGVLAVKTLAQRIYQTLN